MKMETTYQICGGIANTILVRKMENYSNESSEKERGREREREKKERKKSQA
jgi:hypothetical protein